MYPIAFVPAVLLCALVRICSQRRQLDFATVDGDLRALEAHDGAAFGQPGRLQRPHSLPVFENAVTKKNLARGRNFLAFALRRSRSTEDVLPYSSAGPDNIPLKPLKIVETVENPLATGNYYHLLLTEDAIREGKEADKRESYNFQLAPVIRKNRSSAVNRMIMSCWSGDFSISSTSSSTSNSQMNGRVVAEGEGDEDCDVCRQMRESVLMMKNNEESGEHNIQTYGSHSLGSGASTPSTTSTSGFGQQSGALEKTLRTPVDSIISNPTTPTVEFRPNSIEMTSTKPIVKTPEDALLDPLKHQSGQYDNPSE
ncbi:unnamed protein product [Rodentolepis nana]|uniref:Secreted phosphoprotein 24 n=1 Tax=Rodentolepis nana TaxID=102285 RepID=A0A0R3TEI2_RODNA|nr:unnamed protein product [Rodentolepis nana]